MKVDSNVSYQQIDPLIKKNHPLKSIKQYLVMIFFLYCVGVVIFVPFMIFYNTQLNNSGLMNDVSSALTWPLFVVQLLNYFLFYFGTNSLEISKIANALTNYTIFMGVIIFLVVVVSAGISIHFHRKEYKQSSQETLSAAIDVDVK